MDANTKLLIQAICLIISIVIAIIFTVDVKNKIKSKKEFSGVEWGVANGLVGLGFLWVVIAHNSINKEIEKVKDKKYKQYAQDQMKKFIKTYAWFVLLWLIISFVSFQSI